ncbi:hypothetical protein RISK_005954 [Rhodopirellula islandica]|uniref:HAMP domain-containing protein n=1 Tax=Rhodopirellula islandica TaxID=595434 RepID=A0A0J1E910_RHOIS|nr:hypothetical protein [Rhodopirellula islandica]KLU01999.1 hypothetical protein RISK_005954 [Rhodopirellula islandica]
MKAKRPTRPLRQQLLIDSDVQVALILRAVLYGTACVTYFVVIQFFTQSMIHPGVATADLFLSLTDEAIYWVPGLLVLGPLMIYDVLKVSNRFAGPIFSMRREMQNLIDGKEGRNISFRNDDHWSAMAMQFNTIREEVLELRAKLGEEAGAAEDEDIDEEDDSWMEATPEEEAAIPVS